MNNDPVQMDPAALPVLERVLDDPDPVVRGHAAWALGRIAGEGAAELLERRIRGESDAGVRREIEGALERIGQSRA